MKILDATCGAKQMWFQKNHPLVTYLDKRNGKYIHWDKKNAERRVININPDVVGDFTNLDFEDNIFDMVLFDPPHIIAKKETNARVVNRYGILNKDNWKQTLSKGISELFRVLKPEGVFVLKWCENTISVDEIIKLSPYPPLFGSNTKSKGHTANFWILFIKYDVNEKLNIN